eukprot:TRINITY_DN108748_c0_g1_i1.p1 TRINITY_DN108748_c0_g1~~TRINITY_DN108748_c0_g1_i1.p1  ORF type:complete len:353 (-),score=59.75 TRINITY_DN108748_c0_g1_i1:171-1229(-)
MAQQKPSQEAELQKEEQVLTHVYLPSGDSIDLVPPVNMEQTLLELRQEVADALTCPEGNLSLILEGSELFQDTELLSQVCFEAGVTPSQANITVVKRPCKARADEYKRFIEEPGTMSSFARPIGRVSFPEPCGININMMPFVMNRDDNSSLPEEYHGYWPLIQRCLRDQSRCSSNQIGYLTIHESLVQKGVTQRRAGVHIESTKVLTKDAGGRCIEHMHPWGMSLGKVTSGGLYMCSNVDDSCQVWDLGISDPLQVAAKHGCLEHLRDELGVGEQMKAGEMWWITDKTPHESLPLKEDAGRQFFRLVAGQVGVWYSKHSTPNRLGVVPDPSITQIASHDKFDEIQTPTDKDL